MRILALFILCAALPVMAAEPTRLHLAETAERAVANDRFVAVLEARREAATARAAQAALNTLVAGAMDIVAPNAALHATTQGYDVRPVRREEGAPARWIASQRLHLEAASSEVLVEVVAVLQDQDLALRGLAGRLSRAASDAVHDELVREALTTLNARAGVVATALELRHEGWQELRIDGGRPMPRPAMAEARALDAAPPPVLDDPTTTVRVEVGGTARLVP